MISITGITDKYVLQPSLIGKHKQTIDWLSFTAFAKAELSTFQVMLDRCAPGAQSHQQKKQLGRFQSLILYYTVEVIEEIRRKLRDHENKLARMLELRDELETSYFQEHDTLMEEASAFQKSYYEMRQELISWASTVPSKHP